ncbi:MAG: alpha-amylase family protein [Micrococcus sp.]|nr:alpha-amylase family protein [Micrococcus sp.]
MHLPAHPETGTRTEPTPLSPQRLADMVRLRWERHSADLEAGLRVVYPAATQELLDRIGRIVERSLAERSPALHELDERRLLRPDWLQHPTQVGYVAYADRFAGTLAGVRDRVDHLAGLGVTHLHLMPLLTPRPGPNDGGYAVADYRSVREDLGAVEDLAELAGELRSRGISLEIDLVLNHVAREHEWAERAQAGEQRYLDYFLSFPDREQPDLYERTLPEIFPDFAPGNFTWDDATGRWMWTTFNDFQWDLDWSNPEVFCEFLEIILFWANHGVDVFRLDAIAFMVKRLGTNCQNQPEVHAITQALRAAVRMAAPAVAFKAEAIVGPKDLMTYFGRGTQAGVLSDTAYHNSLMAQLWSTLASQDVRLLRRALEAVPAKPPQATWSTYVRCHDDIGWAVDDADAAEVGLDGAAHRSFLSDFYSGDFFGSFARGLVFQENPETGDRRISGSLASLAGLEDALERGDAPAVDAAVRRMGLLYAVVFGFGGIPLIYMGDEIALLNDYGFAEVPEHAPDNRWVHRPRMDWDAVEALREEPEGTTPSPAGRMHAWLRHLAHVKGSTAHLHASVESVPVEAGDHRVLMLVRRSAVGAMVQVYNFSGEQVRLPMHVLRHHLRDDLAEGDVGTAFEMLTGHVWDLSPQEYRVPGYGCLWFVGR